MRWQGSLESLRACGDPVAHSSTANPPHQPCPSFLRSLAFDGVPQSLLHESCKSWTGHTTSIDKLASCFPQPSHLHTQHNILDNACVVRCTATCALCVVRCVRCALPCHEAPPHLLAGSGDFGAGTAYRDAEDDRGRSDLETRLRDAPLGAWAVKWILDCFEPDSSSSATVDRDDAAGRRRGAGIWKRAQSLAPVLIAGGGRGIPFKKQQQQRTARQNAHNARHDP